MLADDQWPVARLIPISSASGIEAQERRAASALLAVLSAVAEFGRQLLKPLGAPAGRVDTFIEVPFKVDGRTIRPDGVIAVSKGARKWRAIVEAKTGTNSLDPKQMEMYLDLARQYGLDAVISISNQYVTSSSAYPILIDKKKVKKVAIHHWSWVDILTEAVVQKQHRGVKDPDQAYILSELIRYLSDPRSGALTFGNMGPSWTFVRDGARDRSLRKTDPQIEAVALRWDDLIRYVCLDLTKDLGRDVRPLLPKSEHDPSTRLKSLKDTLADHGRLSGDIHIPDVVGTVHLVSDLRARRILVSTTLDAPGEGRSKSRVSWLMRQLQKAPDDTKIDAKVSWLATPLSATLSAAREDPGVLHPEKGREIRQFTVSLTRDMGLKRDASRGSFIQSVILATKTFYGDVLQHLSGWKARPAKLPVQAREPQSVIEEVAEEHPPLAEPIEEAIQEVRSELPIPAPNSDKP
jgi:hypothetical protein